MDTHFSSSLLRIAPVWTALAPCLASEDLSRLLLTGSLTLIDQIKTRTRHLNLCWTSIRYIDLNRVLDFVSQFKQVHNLDFSVKHTPIICLPTANASLLPRTLTSLSLSFRGVPGLLLRKGFGSLCPDLIHLDLNDTSLIPDLKMDDSLHLLDLPAPLVSLRIQSMTPYSFQLTGLEALPVYLERLELLFRVKSDTSHLTLPRLPSGLKYLHLLPNFDCHWNISFKDLPSTLETFQFQCPIYRVALKPSFLPGSVLAMEDSAAKLPNLKTFIVPSLHLSPAEAINILPPSLTHIEVLFGGSSSNEDLETFSSLIAPKLGAYSTSRWPKLDQKIFDGQVPLPRLKKISSAADVGFNDISKLAQTAPHLEVVDSLIGTISMNLKVLMMFNLPPDYSFPWTPSHNLTNLDFPRHCRLSAGWIDALPNTLMLLIAAFSNEDWKELFETMLSTPARLHRLAKIQNHVETSFACFGPSLGSSEDASRDTMAICDDSSLPSGIPKQIKLLILTINATSVPLTERLLKSLKYSQLEDLRITIPKTARTTDWNMVFGLLNNLPFKLTTFVPVIDCKPSPSWPVILPKTLTLVRWTTFQPEPEVYEAPEEDSTPYQSFVFPPSVTELSFAMIRVAVECLPPHLSRYVVGNEDVTLEAIESLLAVRPHALPAEAKLLIPGKTS